MKVLLVNGSPRPDGLVSQMLERVAASLGEGWEKEVFAVRDRTVRPCVGCMQCRSLGRCILPGDDGHRFAEVLRGADVLVVGSPCYWGNMNGALKVLFDRVVYAMMGERENGMPIPLHRGKRAVLVVTCNTVWPFSVLFRQSTGVLRALREVLRWSGFRIVGTLAKSGCRRNGELSRRELEKCNKLAKKICLP